MTDRINRAFLFALYAHGEQRRKDGLPYIVHPFEVGMTLARNGADEALVCAGLLHDTIEDAYITPEQLRAAFDEEVAELVLGYPKNMNDTKGERVLKSEGLAQRLTEETGLSVHLWDERLTTVDAHRILSENGRRGKKRKQKVDAVAATLILEGYLGFRRNQKERE